MDSQKAASPSFQGLTSGYPKNYRLFCQENAWRQQGDNNGPLSRTHPATTTGSSVTGRGNSTGQRTLQLLGKIPGLNTLINHLPTKQFIIFPRSNRILPGGEFMFLHSLFKASLSHTDIKQSRGDTWEKNISTTLCHYADMLNKTVLVSFLPMGRCCIGILKTHRPVTGQKKRN